MVASGETGISCLGSHRHTRRQPRLLSSGATRYAIQRPGADQLSRRRLRFAGGQRDYVQLGGRKPTRRLTCSSLVGWRTSGGLGHIRRGDSRLDRHLDATDSTLGRCSEGHHRQHRPADLRRVGRADAYRADDLNDVLTVCANY